MNFLRLSDELLSILFEDAEIIAIDKPYGFNTHTNDSKVGNDDFVQEGLIEIFAKQLGQPLYIVHRLDQTTTGVIIFAKSPEAAKKYAAFFFDRQVKKTYWFVSVLSSQNENVLITDSIFHKGKELEAKTQFTRLKKTSVFELWQASPYTGRNHQIRIHAKAAGISLLGDEKYGGKKYAFICLHNHRIEFPNGVIIHSAPPKYFEDLNILENQKLAVLFHETDRRQRLFNLQKKPDQCVRLVHKEHGFTLDQYGGVLAFSDYSERGTEADAKTLRAFSHTVQKPIVVRQMHNRGQNPHDKSSLVIDSSSENAPLSPIWTAFENQIKYEFHLDTGHSFGLFLDQRLQRNWVFKNSENKSVLNLFSYTGGFSVAAALGKAKDVTSVDTSKTALNWSRQNFAINGLESENFKFLFRDSLDFLAQTLKKNTKYDLIICDPPSFSRGERGVFKIEEKLESLIEICLQNLSENGDLLFSTNFEGFFIDDIRRAIVNVQKKLNLTTLEIYLVQPALDFELVGVKPLLKSFLIRKKVNFQQKKIHSTDFSLEFDEG